jgi:cell division protein ZipA
LGAIQYDTLQEMNRMTTYIILGLLVLAVIAYFFFRQTSKSEMDNYFISTQSQSKDRVKNLNLDKPSEDASYILDTNKLSFPDIVGESENVEYKADPEREWVINLISKDGTLFKKEDFNKIFDYNWRSKYSSTIYGFSDEENGWTYANSGDSPDVFSKLQVAVGIQDAFNEENPKYEPQKLKRYIDELEKRIKKYPTKLSIEQTETVESAISKAKKLVQLNRDFNFDAVIVLQADKQFKGLEMWDALQSVGLKWGDGDLFHWGNDKDYGHDQHFSVWTATEPGYFFPEQIKNGNMNPQNLVFGFSIPRSADPKNIFEIMLNSVKYCQKRMGGQILDRNMRPFNEEKERQELSDFLKRMEKKGLKAGSDKALRMF